MEAVTTPYEQEPIENETGPARYLNRELGWLKFNLRVLHQAMDKDVPLLERVKFLQIFTSNLDEFFMKRVGGLKRQVSANVNALSFDGLTPQQQLAAIRQAVLPMLGMAAECIQNDIKPALSQQGVFLLKWGELSDAERNYAREHFRSNVYPILTPMAVDPGHPFPFLSNLSLSLGVKLYHPKQEERLFARVKVPNMIPSWLRLDLDENKGRHRFISLLEIIKENLGSLFTGMHVLSVTPFRVTRNADVERDEEDAEDLLELVEQELRDRRFERIVRVGHDPSADPWTLQFLMRELELTEQDVYELPAGLEYTTLGPIYELDLPGCKYPAWTPTLPPRLSDDQADIFSVIRNGDLLVHHPYESFIDSVERFIRTAAEDARVHAIKITLYRVGDSRSLMDSLIHAAEEGKQVVCLVELKARFDEQRNIFWAHQLERAGVHVVYGVVGLKTHTKLALVVRQEADRLRSYVHVGTGNYNAQTARVYTDIGLFTCRPHITEEVVELFHFLTGRSLKGNYKHVLVAPVNMGPRFIEMIDREIANHNSGMPSGIIAKMNQLEDRRVIRALYRASQAGVPIRLIVRGFCTLRPGVEGLSENIQVQSIIGRFLEHSRIFFFRAGAEQEIDGRFFIGSGDWMYRNITRRVEIIAPVEDLACRQRLWQILQVNLDDRVQAWDMTPDGDYIRRTPTDPAVQLGSHAVLMNMARDAALVDAQKDAEP